MNLKRKLYPLGHYLSDKAALLEQMFGIIRGEKLKAMLPPALKVRRSYDEMWAQYQRVRQHNWLNNLVSILIFKMMP